MENVAKREEKAKVWTIDEGLVFGEKDVEGERCGSRKRTGV